MNEMYEDSENIEATFDAGNLSAYLLQAQHAEMVALLEALHEVRGRKGPGLRVLDIGIGDGRVLTHISGIDEIWNQIEQYDGIDVSDKCVSLSQKVIEGKGLEEKARVIHLDAVDLDTLSGSYDVIISTWFTVGNFYPDDFSWDGYVPGSYDISCNPKFERIFRLSYDMLSSGGEIVIGSVYVDNESTRLKQEDAYRTFGWDVITGGSDSFVATSHGWWSERFTEEKIRSRLSFVPQENISFIPLDVYDFAMMVRVEK